MNAVEFIEYSKHNDKIPGKEKVEFDTITALMRNRFGMEYEEVIANEDEEAVRKLMATYRHFIDTLMNSDNRIEIVDAGENLLQERAWICSGINNFVRRELLLEELESVSDQMMLSGISVASEHVIAKFAGNNHADLLRLSAEEEEIDLQRTGMYSLRDIVQNNILELQKKIRFTFCARLRFCSGKDNYPKLIWSSSRQVKYFLDIIQENNTSRKFAFILYTEEPLGTGKLIVRTKNRIVKAFAFRNEKKRYRNFTYHGNIAEKEELYFIIKEI